eukprot:352606-Chlamydomonas_euryale.AAC.3
MLHSAQEYPLSLHTAFRNILSHVAQCSGISSITPHSLQEYSLSLLTALANIRSFRTAAQYSSVDMHRT